MDKIWTLRTAVHQHPTLALTSPLYHMYTILAWINTMVNYIYGAPGSFKSNHVNCELGYHVNWATMTAFNMITFWWRWVPDPKPAIITLLISSWNETDTFVLSIATFYIDGRLKCDHCLFCTPILNLLSKSVWSPTDLDSRSSGNLGSLCYCKC